MMDAPRTHDVAPKGCSWLKKPWAVLVAQHVVQRTVGDKGSRDRRLALDVEDIPVCRR